MFQCKKSTSCTKTPCTFVRMYLGIRGELELLKFIFGPVTALLNPHSRMPSFSDAISPNRTKESLSFCVKARKPRIFLRPWVVLSSHDADLAQVRGNICCVGA